jgi:hypothetical protein
MKKRLLQIGTLVLIIALACSIGIAENNKHKEGKEKKEGKEQLSASIIQLLAKNYPNASVKGFEEEHAKAKAFEIELAMKDGAETSIIVTEDGTIMSEEKVVKAESLPFDVTKILPAGAKISKAETEIVNAEFKPVALEKPVQSYELKATVDGKEVEYVLGSDGKIIKQKNIEEEKNGKDADNEDKENDHGNKDKGHEDKDQDHGDQDKD